MRRSMQRAWHVESVRARWLGHRLYAEMTLAVDPTLSLADARKVADDIRGDTLAATSPLWRACMWKWCQPQAGRDLNIIHRPNTSTITELAHFQHAVPRDAASSRFGRAAP